MADMIFYGAGQNAQRHLNEWREKGYVPVCFADVDIRKQHTFLEGIEILPILEAINKYPNYEIVCTQAPFALDEIHQYLLALGIPEERIRFIETPLPLNSIYEDNLYPRLYQIYQAFQDDLSRSLFWGRVGYSLSHNLSSVYQEMVCDANMEWLKSKLTYAQKRYGEMSGLWELLYDNYPVQKNKLYLMAFDDTWNEFEWVVERFLDAMPYLGIHMEGCFMPNNKTRHEYLGLSCMSEDTFLQSIDANARIVIGFPGWCLETKEVLERYPQYKELLYPIADTAHPQYIEDFLVPQEDEIYVDVGVFDFQNSIDFINWAKNGWKKIYAFEPDPKQYAVSKARIHDLANIDINKIELVNKGLSSGNGMLEFPAEYKASGQTDGDTISVEVVSLDSYLAGDAVTFVKMDVEGAEMSVLLGMEDTIRQHKPRLAVCVYHKHEDIFEIASYLLGLVPEYRFYLRHYNSNETETVLFCVI